MTTYVYFIGAINRNAKSLNAIKIGISQNPKQRIRDLQNNNANDLVFLKITECAKIESARLIEKRYKLAYLDDWLNGEWFSVSAQLLAEIYDDHVGIPNRFIAKEQIPKQRLAARIIKILQKPKTHELSAARLQSYIKWATTQDIQETLDILIRENAIMTFKPKRVILYSAQRSIRVKIPYT